MLPVAFVERMREMLGDEAEDFFRCLEKEPCQALRVNPAKGSVENFLETAPFCLTPVPWAKEGFYFEETDRPGKHPYQEAGVYYIQEPSAMLPAVLLEAKPGERILDLCAAPGGKSTQIAAAMKGQGILVCNEIHPARAKILSENIERMGIRNALVTNETPQRLAEKFEGYFDKILVDAPCSGEGMFRKNKEAREEWSLETVQMCAERQDSILDFAAGMLRPCGKMVYSTCTFAPEEDEGSVARFLVRHPEFAAGSVGSQGTGGAREGMELRDVSGVPTLRLWPHRLKGEGHFAAVLLKSGSCGIACGKDEAYGENREFSGRKDDFPGGAQKGISLKDCGEYFAFEKETLACSLESCLGKGIFLRFGEQLYYGPPGMPSVKGLKVLRPGLHLGTVKKNRFEPSHALALALLPQMAKRTFRLDSRGVEVQNYLNGMTFAAEGEKGWYLVTVDGYSLGWGKLAGGILKNHYPKGLRK